MKKKPLVSIIIPYHRKKKYFMQTLKSIIYQSFKNFEIIIIYDDFDLTELNYIRKKIKNFSNIKIIINNKILGPGLSRNKGILISKGKYIAFCDADDLWKKNKLKFQIKFMEKYKLNFSHTSYYVIDKYGKKIGSFKIKKNINYEELLKSCDIGLSTVILKKSIFRTKNFFCKLKTKEDFNLWLKIIKKEKKIIGINKFLVSWRRLSTSLSSSILQRIMDAFRLYFFYEKYNFFKSIFFVIRLSYFAYLKKIDIYR